MIIFISEKHEKITETFSDHINKDFKAKSNNYTLQTSQIKVIDPCGHY